MNGEITRSKSRNVNVVLNSTLDFMNILSRFKGITTLIFDIDGVLTDGSVLVLPDGLQARSMHVKDGFGLQMALKQGYRVFVISGGNSEESRDRLHYLGIKDVYLDVSDKLDFVSSIVKKHKLEWNKILYMGDDLPDLPLLKKSGVSCCPSDAVNEVRSAVLYISPVKGGWGCVRDVIEKVLKVNGHWIYDTEITSK